MKKKILVINDDPVTKEMIERAFGQEAEVFGADSLGAGEELFLEHPDAYLIVMDGCIRSKALNSLPLIEKIYRVYGFRGYMLAHSSMEGNHEDMMIAGCTHWVKNLRVLPAVRKILDLDTRK